MTRSCADLRPTQKRLSPKYFYDKRGSELFDRICSLPEYYVTRTELKLLRDHLGEVAALVGERASVIEFGAGSSAKARLLLDHLRDPAAYVPVDISREFLLEQVESLRADYPERANAAGGRGLHATFRAPAACRDAASAISCSFQARRSAISTRLEAFELLRSWLPQRSPVVHC